MYSRYLDSESHKWYAEYLQNTPVQQHSSGAFRVKKTFFAPGTDFLCSVRASTGAADSFHLQELTGDKKNYQVSLEDNVELLSACVVTYREPKACPSIFLHGVDTETRKGVLYKHQWNGDRERYEQITKHTIDEKDLLLLGAVLHNDEESGGVLLAQKGKTMIENRLPQNPQRVIGTDDITQIKGLENRQIQSCSKVTLVYNIPSVLVTLRDTEDARRQEVCLYSSKVLGINSKRDNFWTKIVGASPKEGELCCAPSPSGSLHGSLHAVANLETYSALAVTVFLVDKKWVGKPRDGYHDYKSSKKFEFYQPNCKKKTDARLVQKVCWSPDGKFISALFKGEPLVVTWFVHTQTVFQVWEQGFLKLKKVNDLAYLFSKETPKDPLALYVGSHSDGDTGLNFKVHPLPSPQDWFRDNYVQKYVPPLWKHDFGDTKLPETRVYCFAGDDLEKVRQCVVQRDLVNLGNSTIVRHPRHLKSGYQQLWEENSGGSEKSLPPNFALYTHAPIITKKVFDNHVQENNTDYQGQVIEAGGTKRYILHLIGYAFDSTIQPDYHYFSPKAIKDYSDFRKEFVVRLTRTLDYAFVCAQDLGLKTIVLAFIGGRAFIKHFPTTKGTNTTEAYTKCFQEALLNSIEKVKDKTGEFNLVLEYAAPGDQAVFEQFKDPTIRHLGKIPDAFFAKGVDQKLFVNAWDPHSHAGNGHNADNSLDGWTGRCSAISYLSSAELNPGLADISSYRVVRPTSFSWASVLQYKEKFNPREFGLNVRPCLQDMYGGPEEAKSILENREKVETVFFVKDLCGDPVRFLILLLKHGLIEMEGVSYSNLTQKTQETLKEVQEKGYNLTWSSLAETSICLSLVHNAATFLSSVRWNPEHGKVALILLGNLLFGAPGNDTDLSVTTLLPRIEKTHAPGQDADWTESLYGISAEYLMHLIILHLQASGRQKNCYIFITKGEEEKKSLKGGYTSQYFSPSPLRQNVLSEFYKKAIPLPFQFKNGLDVLCQRESSRQKYHPQIEKKFQDFLNQEKFKSDFFSATEGLMPSAKKKIFESVTKLGQIYRNYKHNEERSLSKVKPEEQKLLNETIELVLGALEKNPLATITSGAELKARGAVEERGGQSFFMDGRIARAFDENQTKPRLEGGLDWSLSVLRGGRLSVDSIEKTVVLVPTYFKKANEDGDFTWMIKQSEYATHFFIYNDNQEAYLNKGIQIKGGGSALIRPYRYTTPPRAFGIPTGSSGKGYSELSVTNKKYIDDAIEKIYELCLQYDYTHVHYSADPKKKLQIGSSIFEVHEEVKQYITAQLQEKFRLEEQFSQKQESGDCVIL